METREERVQAEAEKIIEREDDYRRWNDMVAKDLELFIQDIGFVPLAITEGKVTNVFMEREGKTEDWFFQLEERYLTVKSRKSEELFQATDGRSDSISAAYVAGYDNIDEFLKFLKFVYESRAKQIYRITKPG